MTPQGGDKGDNVRKQLQIRVKKLALAYKTGWEYTPESEEAGSVLTDIFLDMVEGNRERYKRIWEKQELAFQEILPKRRRHRGRASGELVINASDEEHGKWLKEGTEAYALREEGMPARFQTVQSLQLTSARLQYAVYCKGLSAWLSYEYEAGEEEQSTFSLFQPVGVNLAHPVFRWYFPGLCDGMEEFCFTVEFYGGIHPVITLMGKWTVSDGKNTFPADWRQTESGILLEGRTPEFAGNLESGRYEVRLELFPEEEPTEEWIEALCGGFTLRRAEEERKPDLCMTDFSAGEGGRVLPFGDSMEEASCCYLSCDRIMAGKWNEIELRFRESYLTEEKYPAAQTREYEKMYKKYPWLKQMETVQQWQAEDTLWEYFNGNLWCVLPGSEAWKTGCHAEDTGEKVYRWKRPRDMKPCMVEGEEHFYIRLRLRRVRNAYAMYYRKSIPVLEEIWFRGGERCMIPDGQSLPDRGEMKTEKMYLGFDRDVTPDNCWYTGENVCFFEREMIKGRGVRFGREAFWVELTEKGEEGAVCFRPNYVSVRQTLEESETENEEQSIFAGDAFHLESRDLGILDAVCLTDIRCNRTGASVLSGRQTAEHYFAHFGRLLTPMDMELMLQERYPMLEVNSCIFRQEDKVLEVELAYPDSSKDEAGIWLAEIFQDELRNKLPEIENWLQESLAAEGPVWLRRCSVNCCLGSTEDTGNVGTNIAGRQQL